MKQSVLNKILSVVVALLCSLIIIYAIEEEKSPIQILIGFCFFLFPSLFIQWFNSKTKLFVLIFSITLVIYFVVKHEYYDFWIGSILSLLIGGTISYLHIRKFNPFNPNEYLNSRK